MSEALHTDTTSQGHIPVMLTEVLEHMQIRESGLYLDATFGGGGYSAAFLQKTGCQVWAIDRDPDAIARGQALAARFSTPTGLSRLHLVEGGFGEMENLLAPELRGCFDGIVFDLGVSSFQLDEAERGFSFRKDGPLDMRMSSHGKSAADVVNTYPEEKLADIIYHYGEERFSRRIARAIVARRQEAPILTTLALADIVRSVIPSGRPGLDPATRTFQAIRIYVNDELAQVEAGLRQSLDFLAPKGRLVAVSFHSLEDRLVKQIMNEASGRLPSPSRHDPAGLVLQDAAFGFRQLISRPLKPTEAECTTNPRARSARLRVLERLPLSSTQLAGRLS